MEMKGNRERVTAWLQTVLGKAARFKYALLILLLGVVLLLLPQKTGETTAEPTSAPAETEASLEAELEAVLSQVEGAGRVRVLLTMSTGTAYEYQTDVETRSDSDGSEVSRKTVLASAGSGVDNAVTVRTTYPTYKGALVVCEGADSASVRLSIIQAVSSLTGLGSDKITVIKMKQD